MEPATPCHNASRIRIEIMKDKAAVFVESNVDVRAVGEEETTDQLLGFR